MARTGTGPYTRDWQLRKRFLHTPLGVLLLLGVTTATLFAVQIHLGGGTVRASANPGLNQAPNPETIEWDSNYSWPGEVSTRVELNNTVAGTAAGYNTKVSIPTMRMDDQKTNLIISNNGGICPSAGVDPDNPGSLPLRGICSPRLSFDLLVPADTLSVKLLAHDICTNGWDRAFTAAGRSLTMSVVGKNNSSIPIPGNTGAGVNLPAFTIGGVNFKRPPMSASFDCYRDWVAAGMPSNKASVLGGHITRFNADTTCSSWSGFLPPTCSDPIEKFYVDPVKWSPRSSEEFKQALHFTEEFTVDLSSLPEIEQVELHEFGSSKYLDKDSSNTYDRYRLEISAPSGGAKYANMFRLEAIGGGNIILQPKSTNPNGANKEKDRRTINLSNSGYKSNFRARESTDANSPVPVSLPTEYTLANRYYDSWAEAWGKFGVWGAGLTDPTYRHQDMDDPLYSSNSITYSSGINAAPLNHDWSISFDIGPPGADCESLDGADGWLEYWKRQGYPRGGSTTGTITTKQEYKEYGVLLPIGLFDSDLGGEVHNSGHRITVYERPRFEDGGWTNVVLSAEFDGEQNGKNNVNTGPNVNSNATENFWVTFKPDHVYRVKFSEIFWRNFVQFVLPFDQYTLLEKCDESFEVEFADSDDLLFDPCELYVKSIDWKPPAGSTTVQDVEIDIVEESGGTWTSILTKTIKKPAKMSRDAASNIAELSLMKFSDPDQAAVTWSSLIESGELVTGKDYQVRIVGFYDGGVLKLFENETPPIDHVIAKGHNADPLNFQLKADEDKGLYYFLVDPGPPEVTVPANAKSCLQPEFVIDVIATAGGDCVVRIVKLNWKRLLMGTPRPEEPDLRVSLVPDSGGPYIHSYGGHGEIDQPHEMPDPAIEESEIHLLGFKGPIDTAKHPLKKRAADLMAQTAPKSPLQEGQVYQVRLTGYYDSGGNVVSLHSPIGPGEGAVAGVIRVVDNGSGVYRLHYITDENEVRSQTYSNWQEVPSLPSETCGHNPPPFKVIITDAGSGQEPCELRITSLDWFQTNNNTPDYVRIEVGSPRNPFQVIASTTPAGQVSKRVFQHDDFTQINTPNQNATILKWALPAPSTEITFKALLDNGDIQTNKDYYTLLNGYYDASNNLITLPNPPDDVAEPEGTGKKFTIHHDGTGHYFMSDGTRIPSDPTKYCQTSQPYEFEIEITDTCNIRLTKLSWNLNDNQANPDSSKWYKFKVDLLKPTATSSRAVYSSVSEFPNGVPQVSALTPQTRPWYAGFKDTAKSDPTLLSLLETSQMASNRKYEVRITGYYDENGTLYNLDPADYKTAKRLRRSGVLPPKGDGWLMAVTHHPGKYKLHSSHGDIFPPTVAPPGTDHGCIQAQPSEFEVEIDASCNLIVTKLSWDPGDGSKPPLEVSVLNGNNVAINKIMAQITTPPGSSMLEEFEKNRQPLYGYQLGTGTTYTIRLTGHFDRSQGKLFRWSTSKAPSGTPNYGQFTIHFDTDPTSGKKLYYLMVGSQRVPPTPDYCGGEPPEPDLFCEAEDIHPFHEWLPSQTNRNSYNQVNRVWDTKTAAVASIEFYQNYYPGQKYTTNPWPNEFAWPPPGPWNYAVIPNVVNWPLKPIPGRASVVRSEIANDIRDSFEYLFNTPGKFQYRDTVGVHTSGAELYGREYKPIGYIRWTRPSGGWVDSGAGYGWAPTYSLEIRPKELRVTPPNPRATAISERPGAPTLPNGEKFVPRGPVSSIGTYHEFTSEDPMTWGNNQSDRLVLYEWLFYWRLSVAHNHWVDYTTYAPVETEWMWNRSGHDWRDETRTRLVPDPLNPGSFTTETYTVRVTFNHYSDTVGPRRSPPPPPARMVTSVGKAYPTKGKYKDSSAMHSEPRSTFITGEVMSCSWVLMTRAPECVVRRRRPFATDAETRFNLANPDPDPNDYEIFPAGKPDYFSDLELGNYNRYNLSSSNTGQLEPNPTPTEPNWYPRDNNDIGISALPSVSGNNPVLGPKDFRAIYPRVTTDNDANSIPIWPGEYRFNWSLVWSAMARNNWPKHESRERDPLREPNTDWKREQPVSRTLNCDDPVGGIWVYVSAKPPECEVKYTIFEFTDPDIRLRIGLKNYNWVDLQMPPTPSTGHGHPYLNSHPHAHTWQEYSAERPTGYVIDGAVAGLDNGNIPLGLSPGFVALPQDLRGVRYPDTRGGPMTDFISDDEMATRPAPPGRYNYSWDLRVRRGIEWWSTADTGKWPNAWWDGTNVDERIRQRDRDPTNPLIRGNPCEEIIRIVRIPFFKTFLGGASAGGRFGLHDDFDSCDEETDWIEDPTVAQGAWGHSAETYQLSTAIGASVAHSLRAQEVVGGVYSSSRTEQPGSHTNPSNVRSKGLTYANTDDEGKFGGLFAKPPGVEYWRCIPNYHRMPEADYNGDELNHGTGIDLATKQTPTKNHRGQSLLPSSGVSLSDGNVLHIDGDLEISGDIRSPGDSDLRVTIFVDGDIIISGDIKNNDGTERYFGFSDMGLIQIISRGGNILVKPEVNRIDAVLVAYPEHAGGLVTGGGAIDLCYLPAGTSPIVHFQQCSSDWTNIPPSSPNRQLTINGALVAQRIYFGRLHETLQNRTNPPPALPFGLEPAWANYDDTRASEIIILAPEYQVGTPAASVFEDWAKHPKAIFDIPTSL